MTPSKFPLRLEDLDGRLTAIHSARLEAEFERLTEGRTPGGDVDSPEREIAGDPAIRDLLDAIAGDPEAGPAVQRRAELLLREVRMAGVRTDSRVTAASEYLRDSVQAFRPWLAGKPARFIEIEETLREEPDRNLREAAWLAMAPLGEEIEGSVAELLELRNARAREAGFLSFPEMAFEMYEVDRFDYLALCDELEQLTRPLFEESLSRLRDFFGGETLEPWDLDFGLARLGEPGDEPLRETFRDRLAALISGWGLTPEDLPVTVRDADVAYRSVCLPVSRQDIRIVGDFRDWTASFRRYLRSYGTAIHHSQVAAVEGVFLRDQSPLPLASGMLLANLGVERAVSLSVRKARRYISSSLFEILAAERPDGDLHSLHCEINEHYLGFPRHPERLWAADPWIVTHAFRSTLTVLAMVAAAQIAAALRERFGDPLSPEAGRELATHLWGPGASVRWTERIEALTGKPLDAEALLRDLGADAG